MTSRCLFLYSSNQRPLYTQDILDLIAAPHGHYYRFRYFESWIERETLNHWDELEGTEVLVHFAIQQKAQFHDPAFVPVRFGHVRRTETLGKIRTLDFELGSYATLNPDTTQKRDEDVYGRPVRNYYAELKRRGVPSPYAFWAGLGDRVHDLLNTAGNIGNDPAAEQRSFDEVVRFLFRTESFRRALFYRVGGIVQAGGFGLAMNRAVEPSAGRFELRAGRTYELIVAHSQPSDVEARHEFAVSVDASVLRTIGRGTIEISSSYDIVRVPLVAVASTTHEERETVLTIEPPPDALAPRLRLPVLVRPDIKRTAAGVLGSAVAALLLGLPALLTTLPSAVKLGFVLSATVLFSMLSALGLKRS